MPMKMPVRGPMRLPSQPNSSAAGKPTNCVISSAVMQAACFEAERQAVVHRHLDDGVHAVDVEPVREQEQQQRAVAAQVRDGVAELAQARRESPRRTAARAPRAARARSSITGIVNTSHHTPTVTNDSRTACARIRDAEHRRLRAPSAR